jgi:hypothetical protein
MGECFYCANRSCKCDPVDDKKKTENFLQNAIARCQEEISKLGNLRYEDVPVDILKLCDTIRTTYCTCGSGGHPRRCKLHPGAYDHIIREMNYEIGLQNQVDDLREELDDCRKYMSTAWEVIRVSYPDLNVKLQELMKQVLKGKEDV